MATYSKPRHKRYKAQPEPADVSLFIHTISPGPRVRAFVQPFIAIHFSEGDHTGSLVLNAEEIETMKKVIEEYDKTFQV